jgi:pilus assembly protein CpaF
VLGRPDAAINGGLPALRPLAQVLAFEDDDPRFPRMEETWRAFCAEMGTPVREALDGGRSPGERAYAVGAIVHNYFRTRGITLTSYELRALAGELVDTQPIAAAAPVEEPAKEPVVAETAAQEEPSAVAAPPIAAMDEDRGEMTASALVSFPGKEEEGAEKAWAGEDPATPTPTVAETAFALPPSKLVNVVSPETASFDRLLVRVVETATARLVHTPIDRRQVRDAIDAALDDLSDHQDAALPAGGRERLSRLAFSEICGLGLLDRLWADRSIRAVYVDAPEQVHVDRNGVREPAPETFRSAAHLLEIARRLANPSASGIVEFQMRDGGSGLVVFPPAAPAGPVLVLQRGEPGNATFERLIASQMIDRRIAALLGVAARARLNIVVLGGEGAGKTTLLAAIARDLSAFRVVTLATHRQFRWPSTGKIELVAQPGGPSYGALLAAGARLQPDLLVVDAPPTGEIPAFAARLARGARGTLAALRPDAVAAVLARAADLVVRLGPSTDGLYRVLSVEDATGAPVFVHDGRSFRARTAAPAFAGMVSEAGYGEALSGIFR